MSFRYLYFVLYVSVLTIFPFSAKAITVNENTCTLKDAILAAENDEATGGCPAGDGADTIALSANITLAEALPPVTTEITIEGGGKSISGDGQFQIFRADGGNLTLNNLTIDNARSTSQGGALYVSGGDLTLTGITISDSNSGDVGGGVYALDSNVIITNSQFLNNSVTTSHGGALYFASSGGTNTLDLTQSVFRGNQAIEDGGAMKIAYGVVNIVKSTFVENVADEGGAIESSNAALAVENSTFSTNSAREGGGISIFSSDVTMTHVTLAYNSASEQGGGLALVGWTGTLKLRNTLITESTGGGDCHPGPNPDAITEFTGNFIQDGSCLPEPEEEAESQEGSESDAESQEGSESDAESQEVSESDEESREGSESDEESQEGSESDEESREGSESDEESQEGSESDAESQEGSESDAESQEGSESDAESQEGSEPDEESQEGAEPDGESQEDSVLEAEAQHEDSDGTIAEEHQEDAMLTELAGELPLHPLQWGSPAIDAGDPQYCLDDDQADTSRPQYDNCDVGAYEYPKPPPTPTPRPSSPDSPDSPDEEDTPEPPDQPEEPEPLTPTLVPPTPTLPPDCIHTVSAGENLFRIAIQYDMTVREVSSFNNLFHEDQLSVGQQLIIPHEKCLDYMPRKG